MTELGHLLAADVAFIALGWGDEERRDFYLGAIAPDAHRATYGVDYRDLHFRSSKVVGRRLIDFLRRHLRPALSGADRNARAFYTGWLTHICADHIWRQHLRHDLSAVWYRITEGTPLESGPLRDEFYEECDWVDQRLCEERVRQVEDIRWLLQHAHVANTVPPLKLDDINRWRQHVLMELLPPPPPNLTTPQMLSVQLVEQVIDEAVSETLSILDWETRRAAGEA